MESKLTVKQAAEILEDRLGPVGAWPCALRVAAKDLAEALGVELAPDEPELAEWFGKELHVGGGNVWVDSSRRVPWGTGTQVGSSTIFSTEGLPKDKRARRTLVEGYNRWCRIAKHLEERAGILSHIRRLAGGETPDAP